MRNLAGKIVLTEQESARFEELVWKQRKVLLIVIQRALGSSFSYLVDDCLSETMLIACQKADVVLHHTNPEGWLIETARNTARNMMRKHQRDKVNIPIDMLPELSSHQDDYEAIIFNHWISKEVPEQLLKRLTNRERQVYYLLYKEKRSAKDVATELGITESTVYNTKKSIVDKITRAVKELQFYDK